MYFVTCWSAMLTIIVNLLASVIVSRTNSMAVSRLRVFERRNPMIFAVYSRASGFGEDKKRLQ